MIILGQGRSTYRLLTNQKMGQVQAHYADAGAPHEYKYRLMNYGEDVSPVEGAPRLFGQRLAKVRAGYYPFLYLLQAWNTC